MTVVGHTHRARPAAWVDDDPVESSAVDVELARLRSGPRAALLPAAASAEGRQLRRWVAQTLVARRLLEHEADRRGLGPDTAPPVAQALSTRSAAVGLGGVLASVLRQSAAARAVYAVLTGSIEVPEADVRAYLARQGATVSVEARDAARAVLVKARRREVFLDWYSAQSAARVRLEPGYEHPGDPRQPDATHRH